MPVSHWAKILNGKVYDMKKTSSSGDRRSRGFEIAKEFAREGADVIISDRGPCDKTRKIYAKTFFVCVSFHR